MAEFGTQFFANRDEHRELVSYIVENSKVVVFFSFPGKIELECVDGSKFSRKILTWLPESMYFVQGNNCMGVRLPWQLDEVKKSQLCLIVGTEENGVIWPSFLSTRDAIKDWVAVNKWLKKNTKPGVYFSDEPEKVFKDIRHTAGARALSNSGTKFKQSPRRFLKLLF